MKNLLVVVFIFFSVNLNCQSLEGKWIYLKDSISFMIPKIQIYELAPPFIFQCDFDKRIDSAKYFSENNTINIEGIIRRYEFEGKDRLKIIGQETFGGKDTLITTSYLRIIKSKTKFLKEEIEQMSFTLNWSNKENKIIFNKLLDDNSFKLSRFQYCNEIKLEKLDDMLFISIYCRGTREYVFPIKEVLHDRLIIYDYNLMEIEAKRINNQTTQMK